MAKPHCDVHKIYVSSCQDCIDLLDKKSSKSKSKKSKKKTKTDKTAEYEPRPEPVYSKAHLSPKLQKTPGCSLHQDGGFDPNCAKCRHLINDVNGIRLSDILVQPTAEAVSPHKKTSKSKEVQAKPKEAPKYKITSKTDLDIGRDNFIAMECNLNEQAECLQLMWANGYKFLHRLLAPNGRANILFEKIDKA